MEYMDLGSGSGSHEREARIGPREGEMIKFRDLHTPLVFRLTNGEKIEGRIEWCDSSAVRLLDDDGAAVTVFFHSIAYYKQR